VEERGAKGLGGFGPSSGPMMGGKTANVGKPPSGKEGMFFSLQRGVNVLGITCTCDEKENEGG